MRVSTDIIALVSIDDRKWVAFRSSRVSGKLTLERSSYLPLLAVARIEINPNRRY
jgi:hypothetical protein